MEQISTRQRILEEALTLFAEMGFAAVSVGQIAQAVGIKAPSLYKHYKSKRCIFDAILSEMSNRYEKLMTTMQMDGTEAGKDANHFISISEEQLVEMGKRLFLFYLHDEYTCKFRRMLTIEQYHSSELAALYVKQYADSPLSYQEMALGMLAQAGILIPENRQIMALHFYAPMFLLLTICECHPEREAGILQIVEQHIRQFNRVYKRKED